LQPTPTGGYVIEYSKIEVSGMALSAPRPYESLSEARGDRG
jgi:hypothetical protein